MVFLSEHGRKSSGSCSFGHIFAVSFQSHPSKIDRSLNPYGLQPLYYLWHAQLALLPPPFLAMYPASMEQLALTPIEVFPGHCQPPIANEFYYQGPILSQIKSFQLLPIPSASSRHRLPSGAARGVGRRAFCARSGGRHRGGLVGAHGADPAQGGAGPGSGARSSVSVWFALIC